MIFWRRSTRQNTPRVRFRPGSYTSIGAHSRRLATPRERALDTTRTRLLPLILVFCGAWLLIAGRLSWLALSAEPSEQAQNPSAAYTAAPKFGEPLAMRADIVDRHGNLLAASLPTISLCANGGEILDANDAEKKLLSALPALDSVKLRETLRGARRCAMIKRHLTPRQAYEVNRLGIVGLEFRPDERRLYPTGNLAAHVVGYTDIDNNGLAGIEKSMDKQLTHNQQSLALSLDLRLQTVLRGELTRAVAAFRADGAAGLIMNTKTGEILALVSLPDFDSQHPGDADEKAHFNRVSLGVYEMGSTFKIFNTAMALDSGAIRLGDVFDTVHSLEVGGRNIRDFEQAKHKYNVAEIFIHSSNIGSALMASKLGNAKQRVFLSQLGLTTRMAFELPETGSPLVPSSREWGEAATMTISYGHGIAVNAVQLAGAVATIVNDGFPVRPTLLKQTALAEPPQGQNPVISAETSAIMRSLMRLVVTNGTGRESEVGGYLPGGKTGTADKLDANHRYSTNARLSSFVGVFPANDPQYLVFAMLDDPKGSAKTLGYATGGKTAAPVVGHVITQIGPLLDLPPMSADVQKLAEQQLFKPLGASLLKVLIDDEESSYASIWPDSPPR
ncbi:MAG: penicillin-binding protein 2 [Bdellovibrionales bacterium]